MSKESVLRTASLLLSADVVLLASSVPDLQLALDWFAGKDQHLQMILCKGSLGPVSGELPLGDFRYHSLVHN